MITSGYYLPAYARIIHLQVVYIYIYHSIKDYYAIMLQKLLKILEIAAWTFWTYLSAFLRADH